MCSPFINTVVTAFANSSTGAAIRGGAAAYSFSVEPYAVENHCCIYNCGIIHWVFHDMSMSAITIAGYVPGAIGRVAELHARYYSKAWHFGLYFEAKVASELSEFLRRFDPGRDGFWTASQSAHVEGSIAIDGARAKTEGAHLRWFILSDALRGQGVGNRLMQEAVGFCRRHGYARVYLWTFQGLDSARHLYEKFGFRLAEQIEGEQWGKRVLEQRFVLVLA